MLAKVHVSTNYGQGQFVSQFIFASKCLVNAEQVFTCMYSTGFVRTVPFCSCVSVRIASYFSLVNSVDGR